MEPGSQPPSPRPVRVVDLVLTCAAVVLGLLTVALQSSADDATWRDVNAPAIALVLLMTLPAATCRRAPIASAVIALTAALSAAALGYPPTSGWFSALLIAAARVYLPAPPPAPRPRRLPPRPPPRRRARNVHADRRCAGVDRRHGRGGRAARRLPADRQHL